MSVTRIVRAQDEPELFLAAEGFVRPHERCCCALMQRVEAREKTVFVLRDGERVCGVFSHAERALMLPCLPEHGKEVRRALSGFFREHEAYCVSGNSEYVGAVMSALRDAGHAGPSQVRFLALMSRPLEGIPPARGAPVGTVRCTEADAESLFPLQCAYLREEVIPPGGELYLPLERMKLERALKQGRVRAVLRDGRPVAKAQVSASSRGFVQVGGVFTQGECRGRGYASALVQALVRAAAEEGKECVLFVDPANSSALHVYQAAGFVPAGWHYIAYYD